MKLHFTKEQIEAAVKNSNSISGVIRSFNKPKNGYYASLFKKWIEHYKCDCSHFIGDSEFVNISCQHCQKEFQVLESQKNKRKFCSLLCANQKVRGCALPKPWEELDGKEKHRRICFRYHEKKCVVCGEQNIVAVHHYDENHNNDDPKNLIPVCPTHHMYLHSRYKDMVSKKVNDYYNNFNGVVA
jgi:hypothetical protein